MKSIAVAFVVVLVLCSDVKASPVSYQKLKVGRTWVHVVTADLNNSNVKVTAGISRNGRGSSEKFSSMISRTQPKAAITGTFFDTRSLLPIGDIAIDGQVVHSGYFRTALCVSPDNKARVVFKRRGTRADWSSYDTVMCGGITLVKGGRIALTPRSEGFRDRALFRAARRTAVGVTGSGKLLMVSVNHGIFLRNLAHVMVKLGAIDAIALDGGSSTALYYGGRAVASPARKLTNVLLVYDNVRSFEQARRQLAPTILTAKAKQNQQRPLQNTILASAPFRYQLLAYKPQSNLISMPEIKSVGPLLKEPEIRATRQRHSLGSGTEDLAGLGPGELRLAVSSEQ